MLTVLAPQLGKRNHLTLLCGPKMTLCLWCGCIFKMLLIGGLFGPSVATAEHLQQPRGVKIPPKHQILISVRVWNCQFPVILSRFFNFSFSYFSHSDVTVAFCLPHRHFCFESLWNIVPKQPRSHIQRHMHHPHVQHLQARWCVMLLMSDLADMICQVLAAGTWGSSKHRHDLCGVEHALFTRGNDMYTHRTGCASESPPECDPVKGTIDTAHAT